MSTEGVEDEELKDASATKALAQKSGGLTYSLGTMLTILCDTYLPASACHTAKVTIHTPTHSLKSGSLSPRDAIDSPQRQ